jgi:predicted outer membrane protein
MDIGVPGSQSDDRFLATWLHNACVNVVALARMAVTRSKNPTVQAFARDVLELQHGLAVKLQLHTRPVAVLAEASTPAGGSGARATRFDSLTMLDELGNRFLQSQTASLSGKWGPEFDRSYVAMQVLLLRDGLDLIETSRTFAGVALRVSLASAAVVMAKHLEVATNLERQLAATSGDGAVPAGAKPPRHTK